jgi:3-oxoacyl-[acyl-carrier protein] reductase
MDMQISSHRFVVCGASAGLGLAVANALLEEGAQVIAVARNEERLQALKTSFPKQVLSLAQDITAENAITQLLQTLGDMPVHGLLINAGGPPAKAALETSLEDWDAAYQSVFRWKTALVQALLPGMIKQQYGRILFIESVSVKQPVANLVLSNAMRLAVVGFAKTVSAEVAATGVTVNVLAPGYHDTDAIKRLVVRRQQTGMSETEARQSFERETGVGRLGTAADFGSLACWLMSLHSRYITGQTISVDGGLVKGLMG